MTQNLRAASISLPGWAVQLALVATLYLIYAPTFTSDYLTNDEMHRVGRYRDISDTAIWFFLNSGRYLFGIYSGLVYEFAEFSTFKIQVVRFVHFSSMAALALVILSFVYRLSQRYIFAFLTVLFFFAQPWSQSITAQSLNLISNSQPAIWLSLAAFYLHFFAFEKWRVNKYLGYAAVFVLFMLAMQSTQTYAYFCMIPLTYLVLKNGEIRKTPVVSFFAIAALSFICSAMLYKLALQTLHSGNEAGYARGEEAMGAFSDAPWAVLATALNPMTYWSAFKLWSYPFPFHSTPQLYLLKRGLAIALGALWLTLVAIAVWREFRDRHCEGATDLWFKWGCVAVCLVFGALFIVANSPLKSLESRPHISTVFVGVVIFSAAYAIERITMASTRTGTGSLQFAAIAAVLLTALGAQTSVQKGFIEPRGGQLEFIRNELSVRPPSDYDKILILTVISRRCVTEPCDPWAGKITHNLWHERRANRYKYVLHTLGIDPASKALQFVDQRPARLADNEILVDWAKFVRARVRYADSLNREGR